MAGTSIGIFESSRSTINLSEGKNIRIKKTK
jgi:hypothetical protein